MLDLGGRADWDQLTALADALDTTLARLSGGCGFSPPAPSGVDACGRSGRPWPKAATATRVRAVDRVLARAAEGICPRCDAGLGQFPAWSRATDDRCIPVCGECGSHEAARAVAQPTEAESIAGWPLDASEVRVQFQAVLRHLTRPTD
jgi:hypothetical protein